MYLKQSISNGKPYLSFVQGYRKDGKVKHRTVEKLGYLEDLKLLHPDPVAHFRQVARERTASEKLPSSLTINLLEILPDCSSNRKNLSKENRKDPIVQMGLLMDSDGIPMAFHMFSGGESEKNSLLPHMKQVKREFSLERMILVADRDLNTSDNTAFLSCKNHDDPADRDGYIYGQSILGADKQFKEWVLDSSGYVTDKETGADGETVYFRHKSRFMQKKYI